MRRLCLPRRRLGQICEPAKAFALSILPGCLQRCAGTASGHNWTHGRSMLAMVQGCTRIGCCHGFCLSPLVGFVLSILTDSVVAFLLLGRRLVQVFNE